MLTVPIAFCADENYATYIPTLMLSVLEDASPENHYSFYLFYDSISDETLKVIQDEIVGYSNASINVINVGNVIAQHKENFVTNQYLSSAAYARFFIPDLLPQHDRILYVDIDILVNADVAQLYEQPLDNHILGVIADGYFEERVIKNTFNTGDYFYNVLKLPKEYYYFNSGILLINAKKWRDEGYTQKCLDALDKLKTPMFNDQCVLNYTCADDVFYLPMAWNYRCGYKPADLSGSEKFEQIKNWVKEAWAHPKIVHFMGERKPWHLIQNETDPEDLISDDYSKRATQWWDNAGRTKSLRWLLSREKGRRCPLFKEKTLLLFIKVRRTVTTKTISIFGLPLFKRIKRNGRRGYSFFGIPVIKIIQ